MVDAVYQPASANERADIPGGNRLPRMGTCSNHTFGKGCAFSFDGLEGHRGGNIGNHRKAPGIIDRKNTHRGHCLGPVVQRQSFFCFKHHRSDTRRPHRLHTGHTFATVERLPLPDQDRGCVRQGCKVATGPDRTLFGNDRMHATVQHVQQPFDGGHPDA